MLMQLKYLPLMRDQYEPMPFFLFKTFQQLMDYHEYYHKLYQLDCLALKFCTFFLINQ